MNEEGLSTVEVGSGTAVIWLHGYTMNSSLWAPIWGALPGMRHIGVDLPGHGKSRPLSNSDSLAEVARAVAGVAHGEGAARIVGLSFGSMVAIEVAALLGRQLESLVIAAPTIAAMPTDPHAQLKNATLRQAYADGTRGMALVQKWMASPPEIFANCERDPVLWTRLQAVIATHSWRELSSDVMRALYEGSQTPRLLASISADTLVLCGEAEMRPHRRIAYRLCELLPRCRKEWVPEAGHLAPLEQPVRCARLIAAHFNANRMTPVKEVT